MIDKIAFIKLVPLPTVNYFWFSLRGHVLATCPQYVGQFEKEIF